MIGDLADRVDNNEMIYPTDFVLEVKMQRVYQIVAYTHTPSSDIMYLKTEKHTDGMTIAFVTNAFAYLGHGSFGEFNRLVSL